MALYTGLPEQIQISGRVRAKSCSTRQTVSLHKPAGERGDFKQEKLQLSHSLIAFLTLQ